MKKEVKEVYIHRPGSKLYRGWVLFWFVLVFLLIYPFFVLFIQRDKWKKYGHFMNKVWAYTVFGSCLLPCKVEYRFKHKKNQPYVYCPNHSSYMDIPSLCYALKGYFKFVGKSSLTKVPLFGYMFRNLYIPVDRDSKISRFNVMHESFKSIDQNIGLAIFPEGTIPRGITPKMIPFKDGAFRIAIEKKVPIVPVTIPYNFVILPDDGQFIPRNFLMKVIVHEPIETKDMTLDDVDALKDKTFNIIEQELVKQLKEIGLIYPVGEETRIKKIAS